MWVSLFIALLTYLLSPRDTPKEQRKALLNSAAAGGLAFAATEYTDWGADLSQSFDSAIGISDAPAVEAIGVNDNGRPVGANGALVNPSSPSGSSSNGSGFWSALQSWGPVGTALVATTATGALTGSSLLWIGLAVGAFILLVD